MSGVRYRTDWEYILREGVVTTEKNRTGFHRYNSEGLNYETTILNPDGTKRSIIIKEYDQDGLPVQFTEFTPQGAIVVSTVYKYDEKGYLSMITEYTGQGYIVYRLSFVTNESERSVTQRTWYAPDSIESKRVLFYSNLEKGFVKEIKDYSGERNLEMRTVIRRSEAGIISSEEIRNAEGDLLYYIDYQYTPQEWVQSKVRIYPDGSKIRQNEYNYTSTGLLTGEIEFNQKGEIVRYFKYTYD